LKDDSSRKSNNVKKTKSANLTGKEGIPYESKNLTQNFVGISFMKFFIYEIIFKKIIAGDVPSNN